MFSKIGRVAAAVTFAGVAVSSCTVNPADTPSAPAPTTSARERPKDLSIAGKSDMDFCLLSEEQQVQLGVGRPGPAPKDGDRGDHAGCTWLSPPGAQPSFGVSVYGLPMSLKDAVAQVGPPLPETSAQYEVAGYPAQQVQPGDGLEAFGCRVEVDVADGQTLDAFVSPSQTYTMSNQDMCARAKQVATFAVENLKAQG